MIRAVKTGLPDVGRPFEWAILAENVLYTVQLPLKMDGSFETGDIAAQTELTLTNLRRAVEAAGGTLADVTQAIVYLPDPQDFAAMNAVYGKYFSRPCPNRATLVSNLVLPGARIENHRLRPYQRGGEGHHAREEKSCQEREAESGPSQEEPPATVSVRSRLGKRNGHHATMLVNRAVAAIAHLLRCA